MTNFDISINIVESFIYIFFIFSIFGKRNNYLAFIIFFIIRTLNTTIYNYFLLPEIFLYISNFIILYIYLAYLNKYHFIQNLFLIFILETINNIAATFSMIITFLLFGFPFYEGISYIFLVIFSKILFFIISFIVSYILKKAHLLETSKMKNILLSIFILNIVNRSVSDLIYYNHLFNKYIITIIICLNILSVCLFVVFSGIQKEQLHVLDLQKNKLMLENQEQTYKLNQQNILQLNKWKHDMKYLFHSLDFQLTQNNIKEALDIVRNNNQIINNWNLTINSGNELLNYLLLQKSQDIIQNNIEIFISYVACSCPLSDTHFCIIIGNLLENAIENCKSLYSKRIGLTIESKGYFYYIEIKNTIIESVLQNNPSLLTQKDDKENHGIGLKNIQLLLDKYQGQISFHEESDSFIVRIIIPIK